MIPLKVYLMAGAFGAGLLTGGWGVYQLWTVGGLEAEVARLEREVGLRDASIKGLNEANAKARALADEHAADVAAYMARVTIMEGEADDLRDYFLAQADAGGVCELGDDDLARLRGLAAGFSSSPKPRADPPSR